MTRIVPNPVPLPTLNPFLKDIVSIAANTTGGFAIDRSGVVRSWGGGTHITLLPAGTNVPLEVTALSAFGPIAQIACASDAQCMAVTTRGEIVVWGVFSTAMLDDGTIVTFVTTPDRPLFLTPTL